MCTLAVAEATGEPAQKDWRPPNVPLAPQPKLSVTVTRAV